MILHRAAVVAVAFAVVCSGDAGANASVPEVFGLDGVAGYVEGRARGTIVQRMNAEAAGWAAEAFAEAFGRRRTAAGAEVPLAVAALADAAVRAEVQAVLQQRLAAWLPAEVQRAVAGELLGGAVGTAGDEAAAIAQRAATTLGEDLGDVADAIVGAWYEAAVETLRNEILGKTANLLDVTRLRASIDKAFRLSTAARLAEAGLAKAVGDATVAAIRRRIGDALDGRLPPEAIAALERGPQEFERFAAEVESRLPGAQLEELKNSILNRPLIKLPSAVYAAMLAASAAGHYARAFAGPTVDVWELKRGGEVTRVMVWQLENREWISLTLAQLGQLARGIALRVGAGETFGRAIDRIRVPLDRVQKLADKIDALAMKPIGIVRDELDNITGLIREELESTQRELLRPIDKAIDAADRKLAEAGDAIEGLLPEGFDGVPRTWREAKEKAGLAAKKPAGAPPGPSAAIAQEEEVPADDPSLSQELDPVLLHNGEFVARAADVVIPGRGVDFRFVRTHRARSDFLGELGWRWTHSYAERLLPWNDGVSEGLTHIDAEGLKFFYRREHGRFVAPEGVAAELIALENGGYALQRHGGAVARFDAGGKLAQRCDRFNNCETLRYDRRDLVVAVVDPFGREVSIERRPDGLIRRVRDFAGRAFTYEYNDAQELIGVTTPAVPGFPEGKTTAYRCAPGHRIAMIVDPAGRAYLRNRYDEAGRVVAQRYGKGPWMSVAYGGGDGSIASRAWVTDAKGVTRLYEHDAAGHLVRRWRLEGEDYRLLPLDARGEREPPAVAARRFDAFGQVVEERDASGEPVRYDYYPAGDPDGDGVAVPGAAVAEGGGYLRRIVRADGSATTFAYDPVGNVTAEADGEGRTSVYRVNALNQIVIEERPGEPALRYAYDANDNLRRVETERDNRRIVREFVYDELDRLVLDRRQVEAGRFLETRFEVDAAGLLVGATMPEGNRIAWEYDEEGLLRCIVRGSGAPGESRECVERDARGEAVAFVDGEGGRTALARDEAGDVVALTDPLGNRSDIERDGQGRIVKRQAYDARGTLLAAARFSYGADGRLTLREDLLWRDDPATSRWVARASESRGPAPETGDGGERRTAGDVRLERDDLGRPIAAIRGTGAEAAVTRYAWTGNSRLASITDPAGRTTRFAYDALDRLVLELFPDGTRRQTSYDRRDRVVASTDRNGSVLRMAYDAAGRLVARIAEPVVGVVGTREQRFGWDGLGRLVSAVDANDANDPGDDAVTRFVYDSLSRPVAEEAGGGWVTRLFDDAGRMTALMLPDGAATYFAYGDDGRFAGALSPEGKLTPLDPGAREGNVFDGQGRILRETGFAGIERRFARDGLGRLVAAEDLPAAAGDAAAEGTRQPFRSWRYAWDAEGRVVMPGDGGRARAFDAAGNLVADGGRDYRYDALGRLAGVWDNGALLATYRYDAFDRRIAKVVGGAVRQAVWNGGQLAGESGATSSARFIAAPGSLVPFATISGGAARSLVSDRLGSVVAVADAAGRVRASCGYDPYGGEISAGSPQAVAGGAEGIGDCDAINVPFGFAGGIRDDETGLLYLRHRYYDPAQGRFLTPDPLGFKASMRAEDAEIVAPSLAFHAGQGGASRATFPNRPLSAAPDYGAFPFGRSLASSMRSFLPGETDLSAYARGDPSTFVDPLGLASLLFDRSEEKLMLLMDGGYVWGSFDAANNTVNPGADPYRVGGNGPFPNGTYAVGLPEFYSADYRYDVMINYELGNLWPGETLLREREWRRDPKNTRDYNAAYGSIRIRVGSWATAEGRAAVLRGLMIHGGRNDYRKKTLGCIRVDDKQLELLAVLIVNSARDGDPVTSLTVRE